MGGLKFTVINTSSPVTAPSPLVFSLGCLLMPFTTEFDAVKLGFTIVAEKVRLPLALSRVAESISTSAGEFVRVTTFPDGGDFCIRIAVRKRKRSGGCLKGQQEQGQRAGGGFVG